SLSRIENHAVSRLRRLWTLAWRQTPSNVKPRRVAAARDLALANCTARGFVTFTFLCLGGCTSGRIRAAFLTPVWVRFFLRLFNVTRPLPLSELLHHVIAREAGRLAVDRRCDGVALFLVEAWRLNTKRRQRDPGAAASSALFFRH